LRVFVGLLFLGATLWIALPVLASEHAPPAPTALFIGVNAGGAGTSLNQPGSILSLRVFASGCVNPVTVEGRLERAERTWEYDDRAEHHVEANERETERRVGPNNPTLREVPVLAREEAASEQSLFKYKKAMHEHERAGAYTVPSQAVVVLSGARLGQASIGLGVSRSFGAVPSPGTPNVGSFEEPLINGRDVIERDRSTAFEARREVHPLDNGQSGVVRAPKTGPPTAGAVLTAPNWRLARAPLHFILKADLVYPLGYHRCYVDVPEFLSPAFATSERSDTEEQTFERAWGYADGLGGFRPALAVRARQPDLGLSQDEVVAGTVSASMAGHIVAVNTIGNSGQAVGPRVRYACQSYVKVEPPPNVEANAFEKPVNPNCADTPVFEAPGVGADVTRRIFAAGILGALAATLIVEALFLGETEPSGGSRYRTLWNWLRFRRGHGG
jgi:hypothetical protein